MPDPLSLRVETFTFGHRAVSLYVPEPAAITARFQANPTGNPYWARVWPASIAMCLYLADYPDLVTNKTVLELAAGLGLPSLFVAPLAASVLCSDVEAAAIGVVEQSKRLGGISNLSCQVLDWTALPAGLGANVVLLSDLNYDPATFDRLFTVVEELLGSGATVLLSTPQRLLAKPFITRIQPWSAEQQEVSVTLGGIHVPCSLFVLRID
ncbi:MAG: hypothetical protein JWP27_2628 [Flaviaesturariibacter sp.]|nr:hypothetical protein [Flaviaesturariibacter sp.]